MQSVFFPENMFSFFVMHTNMFLKKNGLPRSLATIVKLPKSSKDYLGSDRIICLFGHDSPFTIANLATNQDATLTTFYPVDQDFDCSASFWALLAGTSSSTSPPFQCKTKKTSPSLPKLPGGQR